MTEQILYDKGVFDNYADADKFSEDFLFVKRRDSCDLQFFEYSY